MYGRGMIDLTIDDIKRAIDPITLKRGSELFAAGYLESLSIKPDGTLIVAMVMGSSGRLYGLEIDIERDRDGMVTLVGDCDCPVGINCKHVAAALLAATQKQETIEVSGGHVSRSASSPALNLQQNLSYHLTSWLHTLGDSFEHQALGEDFPDNIKQRLIYVLSISDFGHGSGRRQVHKITPMTAALLKSGSFGSHREYDPSNIRSHKPAKYLRQSDYEILDEILRLKRRMPGATLDGMELQADPAFAAIIGRILSTGRCRWQGVNGPLLTAGPARKASFGWESLQDGDQVLRVRVHEEDLSNNDTTLCEAVLPLSPPHYVDIGSGIVGPLDFGVPDAVAAAMAKMPAIPIEQAAFFAAEMDKRLAGASFHRLLPLPEKPSATEVRPVTPTPTLHLHSGSVRIRQQFSYTIYDSRRNREFPLALATALFDYDGQLVPSASELKTIKRRDGDMLVITPRDLEFETNAKEQLIKRGLTPIRQSTLQVDDAHSSDFLVVSPDPYSPLEKVENLMDPENFVEFERTVVPQLRAAGWRIGYSDDYPFRVIEASDQAWWGEVEKGSGIDWFSFEMGIEHDGQRINLVPRLVDIISRIPPPVAALAHSDTPEAAEGFLGYCNKLKFHHRLPGGAILTIPGSRLAPVLRGLLELIGPRNPVLWNDGISFQRAEAPGLVGLAQQVGTNVSWAVGMTDLMALGRALRGGVELQPVSPPDEFKAELRPYQAIGLSWMEFLREKGFGGVLADDMGLGKTIQALAFLTREKSDGRLDRPALIIAPTSVLPNWQAEARRFAPSLRVLALRGLDRKQHFDRIGSHDLVLTTYPLLLRDHAVLLQQEFHAVVLDEAQAIKNARASVARLAHRIRARHRFALTGTPLENNLGEVWSLFEFLSPGLLGDEKTFRQLFRIPIEKHGDAVAQSFLTRRLKPFILRRTKQEVASELPPKTEIIERIRLEGSQRDLYETVRSLMHKKVRDEIERKGLAKSHIMFLDALLKLRQICCDPRLLKTREARKVSQSAKLERLVELVPEMVNEGRRILIFSQFTSMLDLIVQELQALKIPYVILTGDTVDRETPVRAFQSGAVPVFLLSLKAGGTGLNLTAADTVIHYDPWWNPAVENQATDRAHRIGQTKAVFVYKFVVEEGIEEAIEILKARKAALADALFAGVSKSVMDLTEQDISALFAPLGSGGGN